VLFASNQTIVANLFDPLIQSLGGRRLILHAGTPKTGSTSLQSWLFQHQRELLQHGILYPADCCSDREPKHQWLIEALRTQSSEFLATYAGLIEAELATFNRFSIKSILLSTEGLSNHFFDLVQPQCESWAHLAKACRVKVILAFRNPLDYALSRYCQNLVNPPSTNPYHATPLSLDDICSEYSWLRALDYSKIVKFWEELIGGASLVCLPYQRNIIDGFLRFGLDLDAYPELDRFQRLNPSMGKVSAQLIRELNETGVCDEERRQALQKILSAEALQADRPAFAHSRYSRRIVLSFCHTHLPQLAAHRPELSLVLAAVMKDRLRIDHKLSPQQVAKPEQSKAFICCIQPGFLEEQVVRLAQSIRLFSGDYSDLPILAVSPCGEEISRTVLQQLESLEVRLIIKDLNREMRAFGYANKSYAIEYIQSRYHYDVYIFLDSDTFFVDEPSSLYLDPCTDFLARPVDMRNICCSPLDDAYRPYWEACCQLANIQLEDIPIIMTSVDQQVIRANWNDGLLAFRGDKDVGSTWRHLIERMWSHQLMPKPNNFWGSGQVSYTIAAVSLGMRGFSLNHEYNIPLHLPISETMIHYVQRPRHIHYHWLLDQDYQQAWQQQLNSLNLLPSVRKFIEAMPESKLPTTKMITGFPA